MKRVRKRNTSTGILRWIVCASLPMMYAGLMAACNPAAEPADDNATFLEELTVVDLHNDRSFFLSAAQIPWKDCSRTQICASRYARDQYVFSIFRPPLPLSGGRFRLTNAQAQRMNAMSHHEYVRHAIEELRSASGLPVLYDRDERDAGLLFGIEGAFLLSDGPGQQPPSMERLETMIRELKSLGVVYVGIVWSNENAYAGVAGTDRGLTGRGRNLVRLLIRHGVLIDLSHASDAAVQDVYELTGGYYPLFFSHSSARSVCDHPRNVSAAQLRLVRETNGLVGVNFHVPYISCGKTARRGDVVRHIQAIVDGAGVEHAAFGGDFDGLIRLPEGLERPADVRQLAGELLESGYSRTDVENIAFRNFHRLRDRIRTIDEGIIAEE